ncbi:MAG TPA: MFS transporter [Pseudomonadales bacterium]|nr:MFS transporter [Pseudomonadales bacterium]
MTDTFEYKREVVREGSVPISTKIYHGVGGLVGGHKDFAFNTFLLLYYSQILGISASLVSVVIAISLIVDAISDPIVGSISDNYRSKWGRRHPFMIGSAIPFGLTLYFLFVPPEGLSDLFILAWLLFFTVSARLSYTFFTVPWHALATEYSNDYIERTSIITFRTMVGWTGGIIFLVCTWQFIFPNTDEFPSGQLNPDAYPVFGLVAGILVIIWTLVASFGTQREVPFLLQPLKATPRFSLKRTIDEVALALNNSNFRHTFILYLMFSGIGGVGGVFDIYMNTYFWEFTPDELKWFAFTGLGAIIAFITVPRLQRKFDKHKLLQFCLSAAMVNAMVKVCFRFWDIWPDNGQSLLLVLLILHAIVTVFFLSICGIMVASFVADLLDEQEFETGRRQEGVFSAALSFSVKATSSIGIIIGGLLLDYVVNLPKQAPPGSVDSDTLFRLAFSDGVAVPLMFFIPIYLISRITLTRERLAEIQLVLEERRAKTASG